MGAQPYHLNALDMARVQEEYGGVGGVYGAVRSVRMDIKRFAHWKNGREGGEGRNNSECAEIGSRLLEPLFSINHG